MADGKIEKREITAELKESYLDYAMSVIVSRALPDVRDGLKPVHRRILWAMWEDGVTHNAKLRKSANVVGSVMGKFHPHGDAAIYDSIARMAQDFSLRYPLIQGQGNWGSIDGDSPAAMRYTECRLSEIAEEMLRDIEKDTVDFVPNYDGTKKEPTVLPTKIPNLLINGSDGIAVGMATKIPPHNLGEVIEAATALIDDPDLTSRDLMKFVQGPDFPTGGIIFNKKEIDEAYVTGRGAIKLRGVAEIEEKKIIISEIPYQVNKSELILKIAELVGEKKLEGIRDIRDESTKEVRIVIELKSDAVPQKILNQLWRYTDLQKDFHLNMLALTPDLKPETMSIKEVLTGFLEHRLKVVRRRAEFDLMRAKERAHILEGLSKALSVIDKIIATIKKSADKEDAHKKLVLQFKLSDLQAEAILEMRLQTLAGLERQKIEDELKEKLKLIKDLTLLLKSPTKISELVKEELSDIKTKFGDERKTKVQTGGLKDLSMEDLVPKEETIVTMSQDGYIKRLPPATFKTQKRGGKGLIGSEVGESDVLTHFFRADTHDNILFFTEHGRVFQTKVYEIPLGSRVARGKAIHNFLEIPAEEKISATITYGDDKKSVQGFLAMVTVKGVIKKTQVSDFLNVRKSGIIAMKLQKGDALRWVKYVTSGEELILTTSGGRSIRFKESGVRSMSRGAAGVKGITLRSGDAVSSFDVVSPNKLSKLLIVMSNGFAKQTSLKEYKIQSRGGRGILTAKVTSKTGPIVSCHVIGEETEVLSISVKGQILKTSLKSVRLSGRATQGVRIMRLKSGDKIAGTIVI